VSDKTIIFGDTSDDLCDFNKDLHTQMINKSNLEIAKQDQRNYCISIGDVNIAQAVEVAQFFDRVIVQTKPVAYWTSIELLKTTIYVCRYLKHSVEVENLDYYKLDELIYQDAVPDCNEPSLYLFGGSIVAGDHLKNRSDRFGELLSQKRNLKIVDHAKISTGLRRSFEQLISSNPKPNDVVILDTTIPTRLRIAKHNQVQDLLLHDCSRDIVMSFTDEQIFYNHVSYINAFVRYTRLLKVKFVFYSNQYYDPMHMDYMLNYSQHPEWCLKTSMAADVPVDFCKDNQHPGPIAHSIIAQLLNQKIIELYETSNIW